MISQKNLLAAKRELTYCSVCGRLTDDDPCNICTDETRDRTKILVVEDSKDVSAMEKIQEYRGLYHVLQGLISPMNGVGPDDINLKSLITVLWIARLTRLSSPLMQQQMVRQPLCIFLVSSNLQESR